MSSRFSENDVLRRRDLREARESRTRSADRTAATPRATSSSTTPLLAASFQMPSTPSTGGQLPHGAAGASHAPLPMPGVPGMGSDRRTGRIGEGFSVKGPVLASLPVLALPDRCSGLHGIDAEPRRGERFLSMGSRHDRHHSGLADGDPSHAVQQSDPPEFAPPTAHLVGDALEAGHGLCLIGFVFQQLDARTTAGTVSRPCR